jgi:surfactin synthase thioesterase subunit
MKAIYNMGEIPKEIYEDNESYDLFYEILFNDFKIIEEYKHDSNCGLLKIPMVILAGDKDKEAPKACLTEWANYTGSDFNLKVLKGNHFFAFHEETNFFDLLNRII